MFFIPVCYLGFISITVHGNVETFEMFNWLVTTNKWMRDVFFNVTTWCIYDKKLPVLTNEICLFFGIDDKKIKWCPPHIKMEWFNSIIREKYCYSMKTMSLKWYNVLQCLYVESCNQFELKHCSSSKFRRKHNCRSKRRIKEELNKLLVNVDVVQRY